MKHQSLVRILTLAAALLAAGASQAGTIRTLFLGADSNLGGVETSLIGNDSRFDLAHSATFNAASGTPTLNYLEQFDSVLYWTNSFPQNGTSLGNLLADYVDAGGLVVRATFVGQEVPNYGRIATYAPFTAGRNDAYSSSCLGGFDASSPIMAGVSTLCSTAYRGDWSAQLAPGAHLVASWSDGRPLVGINAAQDVIDISLFPNVATYHHASGDYAPLFANALAYDGHAVPEPANIALMGLGLLGMGAVLRRRKA